MGKVPPYPDPDSLRLILGADPLKLNPDPDPKSVDKISKSLFSLDILIIPNSGWQNCTLREFKFDP